MSVFSLFLIVKFNAFATHDPLLMPRRIQAMFVE